MANEKGDITAREAGRMGGNKVKEKYGLDYFKTIGHKGGAASPTKFVAGDPRVKVISSMGGKVSPGNFKNNAGAAQTAGRKGGAAKKAVADVLVQTLADFQEPV